MIQPGTYIKSTDALRGTYFEDAVILITEHTENGSIGFVLNRPYGRFLNDLDEFRNTSPWPLLEGGPVDQQHLYILHQRPDRIRDGKKIGDGLFLGGKMDDAVSSINNNDIDKNDLSLFIGYCGWDANELDNEINEGSWTIDV